MFYSRAFLMLLLAAAAGGCKQQHEIVPVEGTVTSGGKPLGNIEVAFYAYGDTRAPRISAVTDSNGRYQLQSDTGQEGTVAGNYKVCLYDRNVSPKGFGGTRSGKSKKAEAKPAGTVVSRISEKYNRLDQTPLQVEVRPGGQAIDFPIP